MLELDLMLNPMGLSMAIGPVSNRCVWSAEGVEVYEVSYLCFSARRFWSTLLPEGKFNIQPTGLVSLLHKCENSRQP